MISIICLMILNITEYYPKVIFNDVKLPEKFIRGIYLAKKFLLGSFCHFFGKKNPISAILLRNFVSILAITHFFIQVHILILRFYK